MRATYIAVRWVVSAAVVVPMLGLGCSLSLAGAEDGKPLLLKTSANATDSNSQHHEHPLYNQEEDEGIPLQSTLLPHEFNFFPRGNSSSESNANVTAKLTRATFTDTCKCGQKLTRIVGGHETHVSEYPWQAAVANTANGRQFCGGSLITDSHVLSAAHCFIGMGARQLAVLLREHSLATATETEVVTRDVAEIRRHPRYDPNTYENDIAILKLSSPVTVSSSVLPVCLPSSARPKYSNKEAVVAGWGALSAGGPSPPTLQEVTVPVLSPSQCRRDTLYRPAEIKPTMLCAGSEGLDSCQGDSGGPLVYRDKKGNFDQIGIVSWGKGCAEDGYPGVYTRVNKFLRWIEKKTRDGVYCTGFRFPSAASGRASNFSLY